MSDNSIQQFTLESFVKLKINNGNQYTQKKAMHKPILCLALLYYLDKKPTCNNFPVQQIKPIFLNIFHILRYKKKDIPDIMTPFVHLVNDGFWHQEARHYGRFTKPMFELLSTPDMRLAASDKILKCYFPYRWSGDSKALWNKLDKLHLVEVERDSCVPATNALADWQNGRYADTKNVPVKTTVHCENKNSGWRKLVHTTIADVKFPEEAGASGGVHFKPLALYYASHRYEVYVWSDILATTVEILKDLNFVVLLKCRDSEEFASRVKWCLRKDNYGVVKGKEIAHNLWLNIDFSPSECLELAKEFAILGELNLADFIINFYYESPSENILGYVNVGNSRKYTMDAGENVKYLQTQCHNTFGNNEMFGGTPEVAEKHNQYCQRGFNSELPLEERRTLSFQQDKFISDDSTDGSSIKLPRAQDFTQKDVFYNLPIIANAQIRWHLSVRAWNVLQKMGMPVTYEDWHKINAECLFKISNCGTKTVAEILAFRKDVITCEANRSYCDNSVVETEAENSEPKINIPLWETLWMGRRAQKILSRLPLPALVPLNYFDFIPHSIKNIGYKTIQELKALVKQCRRGEIASDPILPQEILLLEIPNKLQLSLPNNVIAFLRRHNYRTIGDVINMSPYVCMEQGASNAIIKRLYDFRKKCLYEVNWQQVQFNANAAGAETGLSNTVEIAAKTLLQHYKHFITLAGFAEHILNNCTDFNSNATVRKIVEKRLCYFGTAREATLEEISICVKRSRERVRQIEKEIRGRLKELYDNESLVTFRAMVKEIFVIKDFIVPVSEFLVLFDQQSGWNDTGWQALRNFLKDIGMNIECQNNQVALFDDVMEENWTKFSARVFDDNVQFNQKTYHELVQSGEFPGITESQYIFWLNRLIASEKDQNRKLMLRQLNDVASGKTVSNTFLRKQAIFQVLREAGWRGLSDDKIIRLCMKRNPSAFTPVALQNTRRHLSSDGEIIVFQRGIAGKDGSSDYTLPEFFDNANNRRIAEQIGQELKKQMEQSGFGIRSVESIYDSYKQRFAVNVNSAEHSLDADLPFACMIYILGKFRAGGLRYVDSYAIHPSLMQNDKQKRLGEHTFAWMVYQYYQYFDRSTVQRKEIISFLENCVQMSYLTASRFVLSMVRAGLLEGEYGDDRFYTIKRPQGKQLKIFINNRWKNNDYSLN